MRKWEYTSIEVGLDMWRSRKGPDIRTSQMPVTEIVLNELGAEGWEAVGFQRKGWFGNAVFVFKREIG